MAAAAVIEKLQELRERKIATMSALVQRMEDREVRMNSEIKNWMQETDSWVKTLWGQT